jgi:hypothetical protein
VSTTAALGVLIMDLNSLCIEGTVPVYLNQSKIQQNPPDAWMVKFVEPSSSPEVSDPSVVPLIQFLEDAQQEGLPRAPGGYE